jgi:hypothetical protein
MVFRVPRANERAPAYLLLEDGRRFEGLALGAPGIALGEVVFNTAMTLPMTTGRGTARLT